jgi:DNA-binding HxlR family transcriptional regulator
MVVTKRNLVGGFICWHKKAPNRKLGEHKDTATCEHLSRVLARICDKWALLVVRTLGRGPHRFNGLRRDVGEISQKMLAQALRELEENGFVTRTVTPVKPPQVEYALTELGESFLVPVRALAEWVKVNSDPTTAARAAYSISNQANGSLRQ